MAYLSFATYLNGVYRAGEGAGEDTETAKCRAFTLICDVPHPPQ